MRLTVVPEQLFYERFQPNKDQVHPKIDFAALVTHARIAAAFFSFAAKGL